MSAAVSVVVPVYNGEAAIGSCLRALCSQSLPLPEYEIIVVDDGSTDGTRGIVGQFPVRLVSRPNGGAPAARNSGVAKSCARWVAFTDADCVPSRGWLSSLLDTVERGGNGGRSLGAAGKLVGFASESRAARFVDLTGGLDAERYLSHPRFPFAPSCNLMYRREALCAAGGFDERYASFDACDLHTRLRRIDGGTFHYDPRAVVLHRHRASWGEYWRQQHSYGVGYAQFMIRHRDLVSWSLLDELRALGEIGRLGAAACVPAGGDAALVRRGLIVKKCAQHVGFLKTYWNREERKRW